MKKLMIMLLTLLTIFSMNIKEVHSQSVSELAIMGNSTYTTGAVLNYYFTAYERLNKFTVTKYISMSTGTKIVSNVRLGIFNLTDDDWTHSANPELNQIEFQTRKHRVSCNCPAYGASHFSYRYTAEVKYPGDSAFTVLATVEPVCSDSTTYWANMNDMETNVINENNVLSYIHNGATIYSEDWQDWLDTEDYDLMDIYTPYRAYAGVHSHADSYWILSGSSEVPSGYGADMDYNLRIRSPIRQRSYFGIFGNWNYRMGIWAYCLGGDISAYEDRVEGTLIPDPKYRGKYIDTSNLLFNYGDPNNFRFDWEERWSLGGWYWRRINSHWTAEVPYNDPVHADDLYDIHQFIFQPDDNKYYPKKIKIDFAKGIYSMLGEDSFVTDNIEGGYNPDDEDYWADLDVWGDDDTTTVPINVSVLNTAQENIISGIKAIFIPNDDWLEEYADRMFIVTDQISDKFPFSFVKDTASIIEDFYGADPETASLPEFDIALPSIKGEQVIETGVTMPEEFLVYIGFIRIALLIIFALGISMFFFKILYG